jgi:hypothetical protein
MDQKDKPHKVRVEEQTVISNFMEHLKQSMSALEGEVPSLKKAVFTRHDGYTYSTIVAGTNKTAKVNIRFEVGLDENWDKK